MGVMPTASAYLRYVSMDAMTMRASTVIRSMPTSEILTQASTTMPLSRIRSRTSIRLLPPGARSTAMNYLPFLSAEPCGIFLLLLSCCSSAAMRCFSPSYSASEIAPALSPA